MIVAQSQYSVLRQVCDRYANFYLKFCYGDKVSSIKLGKDFAEETIIINFAIIAEITAIKTNLLP